MNEIKEKFAVENKKILSIGIRRNRRYIHNVECPECHQFRDIIHIRKLIYHIPVCKKCSSKHPRKNLIGLKFGHLTVIGYNFEVGHKNRWKCRCDCGNIKDMRSDVLINGITASCGCRLYRKGMKKDSHRFIGFEDIHGSYLSAIKGRARNHGFIFDLTAEYLWNIYLKQDKKCIYTDIDLYFKSCSSCSDGNASLDRIDSSKGYIEGNVQWVHKDINFMKQAFPEKHFIDMCKLVAKKNS